MRRVFYCMAAALALLAIGCEEEFTPSVTLQEQFSNAYPTAVDVEWEREHGHRVAEFKIPGVSNECEAWYTKSGEWVLTEYKIKYEELPQAVQSSFESGFGATTPVDSVYHVVRNNKSDLYTIECEIVVNGLYDDIFLSYSADGTLVREWIEVENEDYLYYWL